MDADTDELVALEAGEPLPRPSVEGIGLPRLVAAEAHGSRVVAALDLRPPLATRAYGSHDGGRFWRSLPIELEGIVAVAWDVA